MASEVIQRLYISPCDPALFSVILDPTAQTLASDISFHSIPTFPEKPFVYLDLPQSYAQNLKQKFHNTTFREKKLRVEMARPKPDLSGDKPAQLDSAQTEVNRKRSKRKREDGVVPGIELPEGRCVKRGWTQDAPHKNGSNHKAGSAAEPSAMLFRTKKTTGVRSKDEPGAPKHKQKHDKATTTPLVVKEFAKTTKYPTFLRSSRVRRAGKGALSFVDGEGWVDEDGTVIEPAVKSSKNPKTIHARNSKAEETSPSRILEAHASSPAANPESKADHDDSDSSSDSSSSVVSSLSESDSDDSVPSSSASIDEEQPDASMGNTHAKLTIPDMSISDSKPDAMRISEIHPLEALYRRQPAAGGSTTSTSNADTRLPPIKTSFSFFDNETHDDDNDDDDGNTANNNDTVQPPQTPFTKRDLESRSMRSAAPTPDTTAPGTRRRAPWSGYEGEDDTMPLSDGPVAVIDEAPERASQAAPGGQAQTAFEQRFWKERGEYNRHWKARRREEQKEQRSRANKRHVLA